MLYIVVHFLIFPQMYLRFFVGQNLMIYAGFAMLCTHYWRVFAADRGKSARLPMENIFKLTNAGKKFDAK